MRTLHLRMLLSMTALLLCLLSPHLFMKPVIAFSSTHDDGLASSNANSDMVVAATTTKNYNAPPTTTSIQSSFLSYYDGIKRGWCMNNNSDGSRKLVLDYDITRTGAVRISSGLDPDNNITNVNIKKISMDYSIVDQSNATTVSVTVFKDDCETPTAPALPMNYTVYGPMLSVGVLYNPEVVETDNTIWNPTYNLAGVEIGGNFSFCVRAAVVDVLSGYEMDFIETIFTTTVDKTSGAEFKLEVDVDRGEAGEEDAGTVDYSGAVRGFQCDIATFEEKPAVLEPGSSLDLCVESIMDGISIAGWNTLQLSRDEIVFDAVVDGVRPDELSNLVQVSCASGRCVAEVEMVALFFESDGILDVTGSVILSIAGTRRQLDISTKITKDGFHDTRILEDSPDAFEILIPLHSSSSTTFPRPLWSPLVVVLSSIMMFLIIKVEGWYKGYFSSQN